LWRNSGKSLKWPLANTGGRREQDHDNDGNHEEQQQEEDGGAGIVKLRLSLMFHSFVSELGLILKILPSLLTGACSTSAAAARIAAAVITQAAIARHGERASLDTADKRDAPTTNARYNPTPTVAGAPSIRRL
jgi:hypothetical protein